MLTLSRMMTFGKKKKKYMSIVEMKNLSLS